MASKDVLAIRNVTFLLRTSSFHFMSFVLNSLYFFTMGISAVRLNCRWFAMMTEISFTDILLTAAILFWWGFTWFVYNGERYLLFMLYLQSRTVLTQTWLDYLGLLWMDVFWHLIWVIHPFCLCNIFLKGRMTLSSICLSECGHEMKRHEVLLTITGLPSPPSNRTSTTLEYFTASKSKQALVKFYSYK